MGFARLSGGSLLAAGLHSLENKQKGRLCSVLPVTSARLSGDNICWKHTSPENAMFTPGSKEYFLPYGKGPGRHFSPQNFLGLEKSYQHAMHTKSSKLCRRTAVQGTWIATWGILLHSVSSGSSAAGKLVGSSGGWYVR